MSDLLPNQTVNSPIELQKVYNKNYNHLLFTYDQREKYYLEKHWPVSVDEFKLFTRSEIEINNEVQGAARDVNRYVLTRMEKADQIVKEKQILKEQQQMKPQGQ